MRVFVSSTFLDMHAERDDLIKRIFPQLRKRCEERGVTWGEVDLRWGITDEQRAEGKVLPICLAEIRNCQPYFLGILGERYGWVPDAIHPELVEHEPWLSEHVDRSVTELEIIHGVLRDPAMRGHAYFYLRDPAYVAGRPAAEQAAFRERPTRDEIERLGAEEAEQRAQARRRKLAALKDRIRTSGFPVRENYADPEELGRLVLADLGALIDRLYPAESRPDPLDREALEHNSFAASRARVYVGRSDDFERLNAHAGGEEPPLIVLGEAGSGKSALLANWAARYAADIAEPSVKAGASFWKRLGRRFRATGGPERAPVVITHFIGATPQSAEWTAMLRRIMGELRRRLDIAREIPDRPDALRTEFGVWLRLAAERARVVLVLDAFDRLEDRDGALDLVWLPAAIPPNIRLIASTLPGRALDAVSKRGWSELRVAPLSLEERRAVLTEYLAQYAKTLRPAQTDTVIGSAQTANPLFLRLMGDELRSFGIAEALDERIRFYLAATTVSELYEKVLERYEADYERERPRLVGDAMSFIWAARRGLSEAELLELLGSSETPLPSAQWSPLYLALESTLVNRSGLLAFSHDAMRAAVERRYLAGAGAHEQAHTRLADYFESRSADARRTEELPWQLEAAGAWPRLLRVLADVDLLRDVPASEGMRYWEEVRGHTGARMADTYATLVQQPDTNPDAAVYVAVLMFTSGERDEALALTFRLGAHSRETRDWRLSFIALEAADFLRGVGRFDEALELLADVQHVARRAGLDGLLAASLHQKGLIRFRRGDRDAARALYEEAEAIWRRERDEPALVMALLDRGNLALSAGELEEAGRVYDEAETLSRFLGDEMTSLRLLSGRGIIRRLSGDPLHALAIFRQREELAQRLGIRAEVANAVGDQGNALRDLLRLDEALIMYRRQETMCRELSDRVALARCLRNCAFASCALADLDGELAALQEAGDLYRELKDFGATAEALEQQALIHRARGELDRALTILDEARQLREGMGKHSKQVTAYQTEIRAQQSGRGTEYWTRPLQSLQEEIRTHRYSMSASQMRKALGAAKTREREFRASGDAASLAQALVTQAEIRLAEVNLAGAMRLLIEAADVSRGAGDPAALIASLDLQSTILEGTGDFEGALLAHREQERVVRQAGSSAELIIALNNQAMLLEEFHRPTGAAALYEETVTLARGLADSAPGDAQSALFLQRALFNYGRVLEILRKLRDALVVYEALEEVSRRRGDREQLKYALVNRFKISEQLGLPQALHLLGEVEREVSG